jgi:hypothetical protein
MAVIEGRYVPPISDEQKADFLDLICQGYSRPAAAEALGCTARQFRALCSPKSAYFDAEFATRYAALTEPGGVQEQAVVERVESAFIERAVKDSDRAAEKVLAARDPRYAFLRPKTFTGAINVETLVQILPGVSNETLERMIAEAEADKALPEGVPRVIDAA